jgi:hypothetical protein
MDDPSPRLPRKNPIHTLSADNLGSFIILGSISHAAVICSENFDGIAGMALNVGHGGGME